MGANVVRGTDLALVNNAVESLGDVVDVEERALVLTRAVQCAWHTASKKVDELGNKLLGVLLRTIDVVTARDNGGKLVAGVVGADQVLRSSLGGRVRVRGIQIILLGHALLVATSLTVDFIRGHVDETTDGRLGKASSLEQDMGTDDVVDGEGERVTE